MKKIERQIQSISPDAAMALARTYDVLAYAPKLRAMLSAVIQDYDFTCLSKYELHKTVDTILTTKYRGESVLKAALVRMFLEKEVTAAFEMRVNNSRIDFLTVNGDTKSYEIKSGVDNLQKLAKQVQDYCSVFEYNNVVIDERHFSKASTIIPDAYGIYLATDDGSLQEVRPAQQNTLLDTEKQLCLFTKKELNASFVADTSIEEVLVNYSADEVNERFKTMLKGRYCKRWRFLKAHSAQILPVDYQFFYQHNVLPQTIYEIAN